MKLSLDDKIEIVRLYEKDGLGHRSIARKYNVSDFTLKILFIVTKFTDINR